MNPKPSLWQRSTIARFFRWLVRPKTLGRLLAVVVSLATLLALIYAEEYWRGKKAWTHYQSTAGLRDAQLTWETYIPAPVTADVNFAATPFLAPLFDFLPGTQTWRDRQSYQKVNDRDGSPRELARTMGFNLNDKNTGSWERGERTDLLAVLGLHRPGAHEPKPDSSATNLVSTVTTQEQAATILLDILRRTYDPVIEELREASQRRYCRFNIQYDYLPAAGILLPHLSVIRGAVQKVAWRASAELVLGRTNEAFNDVLLGFYLSDTVKNEPLLVSQLVRIATRGILTQVLWEGASRHQWNEAQLGRLQTGLAQDDFRRDMEYSLLAERASGVRLAAQLRTQFDPQALDDYGFAENRSLPSALIWLIPKGWFYLEQINLCQGYQVLLGPMADWQAGRTDTRALLDAANRASTVCEGLTPVGSLWNHRLLETLLLPALSKAYFKAIYAQVRNDLTRVTCALERSFLKNGSYPETLDALAPEPAAGLPKDLMSGQPFHYRRESPQSYVLYSVGMNLTDDHGQPVSTKDGGHLSESGDWVWFQPSP